MVARTTAVLALLAASSDALSVVSSYKSYKSRRHLLSSLTFGAAGAAAVLAPNAAFASGVSLEEAAINAERSERQQARSRARADRRVLARNSKEFLDGKHAVERDKQALEAMVAELEAKEKAATKETKERGKQLRAELRALEGAHAAAEALERDDWGDD